MTGHYRSSLRKTPARTILCLALLFISCTLNAQDSLLYPSLAPGTQAPSFKGKTEKGKSFCLDKIKTRFTLIYFYELHCHLCAVITPDLKKLYDSYHKLGLEIVAVPVQGDHDEWLRYIEEHGLNWINVLPGKKGTELLRKEYLLTVSPTMYLLDRKKILLTQRLGRLEQVEAELNQRIR